MLKQKIAVLTSSRADYGLLFWLLKRLDRDPEIDLQILVTGSHLARAYGQTYQAIEKDGFKIAERIEILNGNTLESDTLVAMSRAILGIGKALERLKPDWFVLLGDRYETFAAAQAALISKVPVVHIAGGDVTEAAYDEAFRHSITKMAHLHFVTHEAAKMRVRQLGENPELVFNVGHLSLDSIQRLALLDRETFQREIQLGLRDRNLLITFHPVTWDEIDSLAQLEELFPALENLGDRIGLLITKANADTDGMKINRRLEAFVRSKNNAKLYDSLGQRLYLNAMRHVDAIVGNSSSGIYEVPSFKKPTVNIGDRQKGRVQAASILNCPAEREAIYQTIQRAFALDCSLVVNPYGDGNSAEKIYQILKELRAKSFPVKKPFFDLQGSLISR